jgi:hypothetical protein
MRSETDAAQFCRYINEKVEGVTATVVAGKGVSFNPHIPFGQMRAAAAAAGVHIIGMKRG